MMARLAVLLATGGSGGLMLCVFEKVGVNIFVFGTFSDDFKGQISGQDDGRFWASVVALCAIRSTAHMNTRFIATSKSCLVAADSTFARCVASASYYIRNIKNGVMNSTYHIVTSRVAGVFSLII